MYTCASGLIQTHRRIVHGSGIFLGVEKGSLAPALPSVLLTEPEFLQLLLK